MQALERELYLQPMCAESDNPCSSHDPEVKPNCQHASIPGSHIDPSSCAVYQSGAQTISETHSLLGDIPSQTFVSQAPVSKPAYTFTQEHGVTVPKGCDGDLKLSGLPPAQVRCQGTVNRVMTRLRPVCRAH